MKRGPRPHKGFEAAIPFALRRGQVMRFLPCPWYAGDFLIVGTGCLAIVSIRLASRFRATVAEIQVEYSVPVTGLLIVPGGGPVSRELWLYSRKGALRYFQVGEAGLTEIDHHGDIPVEGKPATTLPKSPVEPVPRVTVTPAEIISGTADPRGPILRWLAKRNAARKAEGEKPVIPAEPGKKPVPAKRVRAVKRKRGPVPGVSTPEGESGVVGAKGSSDENSHFGDMDITPKPGK